MSLHYLGKHEHRKLHHFTKTLHIALQQDLLCHTVVKILVVSQQYSKINQLLVELYL